MDHNLTPSLFPAKAGANLGILTGNYSTSVDTGTGEIVFFTSNGRETKLVETVASTRNRRYAAKKVVEILLPDSRVSRVCGKCGRFEKNDSAKLPNAVKIKKNLETGQCHVTNLASCGSVWLCPICAPKVSTFRRAELSLALSGAKKLGWNVHLVTLTIPHGIDSDLLLLNQQMNSALKLLSQGRNSISQNMKNSGFNLHGYIRARENTVSIRNGHHPHFHILVFSDCSKDYLLNLYSTLWIKACLSVGLPAPSLKHGIDVRDGFDADEYVSKWGIEFEMTTGHTKQSRKGYTPFQLLNVISEGGAEDMPVELAKKFFLSYASAFKGQRQLHWSCGLRNKLSLVEGCETLNNKKSDEQIANEDSIIEMVEIRELSKTEVSAIAFYHAWGFVLQIAEENEKQLNNIISGYLNRYLDFIDKRRPCHFNS